MRISIIICTRNRAASLAKTLAAIGKVSLPASSECELLVVDNASSDDTEAVANAARLENSMPVRYLREPHGGQASARNTGLAAATGDLIVFTDDDVIPSHDWLVRLCAPILEGAADAVVGGVRLAPHLLRPWMTAFHRAWLASSDALDPRNPSRMVGANMAFSRAVLETVTAFDPELGPGAIGFGDDTLFSMQLRAAGYRIAAAFDAEVEHHFDEQRLLRTQWLESARKMGRADAYLAHHWDHADWSRPWWHLCTAATRWLACCAASMRSDAVPEKLLATTRHLHACLHYLRERRRPRNYPRRVLRASPALQPAIVA
jgi:glycosyltransferase involved in cell wall biosynthesis